LNSAYRLLRRIVGLLGVFLPIILLLWGFALSGWGVVLPSISDYYGLRTRDALVGILFTIGWFLFSYEGYDWRDAVAGKLACLFALCVALFPNSGTPTEEHIHFVSALLLFLTLAYFSLFLFTKSAPVMTLRKVQRNAVYRVCGVIMLVAMALVGLYYQLPDANPLAALHPAFWLETIALWAFGVSWFVKGETLLKD
jgi:hypothetical protein